MLDRALSLVQEGDDLIQKSHYAEDSIQPKCTEIRAVREDVSSSLRVKKDHLLQAMELHHCLERVRRNTHTPYTQLLCRIFQKGFCLICCSPQASKWVDDGIYLLASQPVDKCLSHDGAELALLELERYLDDADQNQLTDPGTIWIEYEAVLNQQFRVRQPNQKLNVMHFANKVFGNHFEFSVNKVLSNGSSLFTLCASGPSGEGVPETDINAGDV